MEIYLNLNFKKSYLGKFLFKKSTPSYWIGKYIENAPVNVVQIGANDGKMEDPLFNLIKRNIKWKVLFIEPVPHLFKELMKNYTEEARFTFENAAINDGKDQTFYSIKKNINRKENNFPDWIYGLGSFNKDNINKHFNGLLNPYIEEIKVKCLSLEQLFIKNRITDLELLHIDAEGYDWKILSQLNLQKFLPRMILFEFHHLSYTEKLMSIQKLKDYYNLYLFDFDCLCIRKNIISLKDVNYLKDRTILLLHNLKAK